MEPVSLVIVDKVEIPADLRICLKYLHRFGHEPTDQSIRNGKQISLTQSKHKVVRSFLRNLMSVIETRLLVRCQYAGVWSSRIERGGFHVPHTHPKGWMSGVVYIEIPDSSSGQLQTGFDLSETIVPEAGKVVLFPSFLPHGTTTYEGERARITVAFDLVKHEIHTTSCNA